MGLGAAGAVALAGVAISAVSAIEAGEAQSAASSYQAQIAKNNAVIANQNANAVTQSGEQQAVNESMKGAAQGGRIRAAQAANGVDVNSGSAVDVQTSQREVNKLDTETTMHNALLEAYGYKANATNFTAQAGLDNMQANQAEVGGYLGAASSLLGGASSISTKWGSGGSFDYNNQTASNNYGDGLNSAGVQY